MNSLKQVEEIANLYIQRAWKCDLGIINFHERGWSFEWDYNSIRRLGNCNYKKKIIGLSKKIVELNLNNKVTIINTILHEIAHAIQYEKMGFSNHGSTWKDIAMSIGCSGERCYDSNTMVMPKTKWTLICPYCKEKVHMARKPSGFHSCIKCHPGAYNSKYRLKLIQNY